MTINVRLSPKTIILMFQCPLGNCHLLEPLPLGISDGEGEVYKPHPVYEKMATVTLHSS